MALTILVDDHDDARCNLRCLAPRRRAYCARYGACLAAGAHRVRALVDASVRVREVVHEVRGRSVEGGHSRTRLRLNVGDRTVVEEVELYCRTLKFDALTHQGGADAPSR